MFNVYFCIFIFSFYFIFPNVFFFFFFKLLPYCFYYLFLIIVVLSSTNLPRQIPRTCIVLGNKHDSDSDSEWKELPVNCPSIISPLKQKNIRIML